MDFIKILGNVINEQIKKSQPTRSSSQPSSKGGWSKVPSHRWESGDNIAPPLPNPANVIITGKKGIRVHLKREPTMLVIFLQKLVHVSLHLMTERLVNIIVVIVVMGLC